MGRASKTEIKYLKVCALFLALVLLASTALLLLNVFDRFQGKSSTQDVISYNTIEYNGAEYVFKEDVETLLIMGLDKYEGEILNAGYKNDRQADFLVLLVFDNKEQRCSAIHINRDAMTEISVLGVAGEKIDTVTKQLALAHTYGNGKEVSCRNTAQSVTKLLLGTRVNHYVSLTMDSVSIINDAVGGVEVEVLDDFGDVDKSLVKGRKVTLMGEQALRYVRSRYGMDDSTNSNRMIRQRQYLKALYSKVLSRAESDENFVVETSLKMSDYIVSDCSVNRLQQMFDKFSSYEFIGIVPLEGEYKVGEEFMEFYPFEDSVKKTVVDILCEKKK